MSEPRTPFGKLLNSLRTPEGFVGFVGFDADTFRSYAEAIRQIEEYLADWTPDELDLLGVLANRLNHGRQLYGGLDLDSDPRQWATEEGEELVDGLLVYAGIRWLLKNLDAMLPPQERPRLSVIPRGEDIPLEGAD